MLPSPHGTFLRKHLENLLVHEWPYGSFSSGKHLVLNCLRTRVAQNFNVIKIWLYTCCCWLLTGKDPVSQFALDYECCQGDNSWLFFSSYPKCCSGILPAARKDPSDTSFFKTWAFSVEVALCSALLSLKNRSVSAWMSKDISKGIPSCEAKCTPGSVVSYDCLLPIAEKAAVNWVNYCNWVIQGSWREQKKVWKSDKLFCQLPRTCVNGYGGSKIWCHENVCLIQPAWHYIIKQVATKISVLKTHYTLLNGRAGKLS